MNPAIILNTIKNKLAAANQLSIIDAIDERTRNSGSSTEIWAQVTHYLKRLDEHEPAAYKLIKEEVQQLDDYFRSTGLTIL